MSTCLAHPDRPATASCSACGADTCAACEIRFRDASWCEGCFAARSSQGPSAPPPPPPPGYVVNPPLRSPGLAAFLSFWVPGLGTMYCFGGPVGRAFMQFAVWAFGLWLWRHADGLLAFVAFCAWTAFWIWQFIDAHGTARMINALGRVPTEDEASAMGRGPFILQNADSRSLGLALVVVGAFVLLVEIGGWVLKGLPWMLPVALVVAGAWIIVRARRRPPVPPPYTDGGLA